MPSFFQGRMVYPRRHRRAGRLHPRLYSGRRPRRAAHNFFGTQVSPYGAGGGGRRQWSTAAAGPAQNVIAQHASQARSGRGMNLGLLHHTPGYTGSRTFKGFRTGGAKAKQDAYNKFIGGKTRKDFGSYADWRRFRRQGKRVASQAKREFAQSYVNPFGTTHKRGRISVLQNPRTGRRVGQLVGFRGRSTLGTQNRFGKIRGRHEAATKRYNWGQKNPTMQTPIPFLPGGNRQVPLRNLSLGGYRYMSPRFHDRLGQAQRFKRSSTGFRDRLGRTLQGLRGAHRKARQFNINQNQQDLNRGLGRLNIA